MVSSDEAGNLATNNNSGSLYSIALSATAAVLLVDEYQDPFFGAPPLSGYTEALDQIGVSYDVWDAGQLGPPPQSTLSPYRAVIWRVPELVGAWTADERIAISNYLNDGGALLVASMELTSRLDENGAGDFVRNVLHVDSYLTDETGSTLAEEIIGAPYETIGNGLDIIMDYSVYANLWGGLLGPDFSDTITPGTNATAVLQNDAGDVVGLRWPGFGQEAPGRLVFLAFPLDAVPVEGGANDRVELLRNILSFLAPGSAGGSSIALDSPAYTIPSRVTVELGDAHSAGAGTLTLTASTTTDPGGIPVALHETTRPGFFSGSFEILSTTNPPSINQLRGRDGDTLHVQYAGAGSGATVSATAVIDTGPPTISNVLAEPEYQQATVSWDTSEPADGLVQFGESPLLNRTAYSASPTTSRSVTMFGLAPEPNLLLPHSQPRPGRQRRHRRQRQPTFHPPHSLAAGRALVG